MTERVPVEIEMRADGSFVAPPRLSLAQRALRVALLVAGLAAVVAAGFLLVGIALLLIPAVLLAGVVAWGLLRFQLWRAGGSGRGR